MVGPNAGELIAETVLALEMGAEAQRHRAHHPPAPDLVGDRVLRGRDRRRQHHRSVHARSVTANLEPRTGGSRGHRRFLFVRDADPFVPSESPIADARPVVRLSGRTAPGAARGRRARICRCSPHIRELGLEPLRVQYLGRYAGQHCFSCEIAAEVAAPEGMSWAGLRSLFGADRRCVCSRWPAARSRSWTGTARTSTAGAAARPPCVKAGELARQCPNCGQTHYPRIAPAVMALVRKRQSAPARALAAFPARHAQRAGRLRRAGREPRAVPAPRGAGGSGRGSHQCAATSPASPGRSRIP